MTVFHVEPEELKLRSVDFRGIDNEYRAGEGRFRRGRFADDDVGDFVLSIFLLRRGGVRGDQAIAVDQVREVLFWGQGPVYFAWASARPPATTKTSPAARRRVLMSFIEQRLPMFRNRSALPG
jgi:hypothetical protein